MSSRGFTVTRQYLGLDTAWRAEFRRGARGVGRIVGVNAEMDALPGIGHGCGHNLIAMAGVAIALALRAALEKHDVPGTVILLGTPGAYGTVQLPHWDFLMILRYDDAYMYYCTTTRTRALISTCRTTSRCPPIVLSPTQPRKVAPASRSSWRRAPIKI